MIADIIVQQRPPFWGYSFGEIAIGIVIAAAVIALVIIALRKFQIQLPEWFVQVLLVVVVAFVIIVAIKAVLAM